MIEYKGLSLIEQKELEVIWNKFTNYGKKMTYQQYLQAGEYIIDGVYKTAVRNIKKAKNAKRK